MASWKSTGTYVNEVPPPGANIVSGMWIFRVKRPPGSPPVFKARYVARGFTQRQGVDFFQTFSPTPKMTTLRVLLHVAAQRDYELHSLDFSTAFLHGSLHEEIWLRRPPGFTMSFPRGTQWSLRRPVYGLRQVPREWHDTLRTTLAALGFAPSTADPSLFLRTDTSLPPFYILVHVVDLVFATADTETLALVKSELHKRHTCTDLGELHSYLGLQITRDRARCTITLTQSHIVQQILQRFCFTWSSAQATPLATGHSLSAPPSDESVEPSGPYPELVGCLMYLMTCTRPDLVYPLGLLACYVAPVQHQKVHMDAAKRVLRYLCSTSGMGLVLGGRGDVVLTGHSDASWVDDQATQRLSQGYTFSLGSGSVSWRSTRSSSVLGSSCEAEIYATAMAAQELRWLTYLLTDLGERPRSPPVLHVDNKAAIALCQEHRLEHRTKHITLCYFLARELQQRGQLRLTYVATRANTADIFTKALPPGDHQRFCTLPVSLGERSRVRILVYAHAGRCRCAEPVSLGGYGRTDPLLKQALLSQCFIFGDPILICPSLPAMAPPEDQRTVILVNVFVDRTVKLLNAFAASCESKLQSLHLRLVEIDTRVTLLEAQIRSTGLHTANGRSAHAREAHQRNKKLASAAIGSTVTSTVISAATNAPATEPPITGATGEVSPAADSASAGEKLTPLLDSNVPAIITPSLVTPRSGEGQNQPAGKPACNAISVESGEAAAAAATEAEAAAVVDKLAATAAGVEAPDQE
ncbi:unnamed protein product [Closterium sp. NIES-54]